MAIESSIDLRKLTIYSIFIRNFSDEGTFKGVIPELERIKEMGVDMIWFLPHYPLGELKRKGKEGSPYAIKDYRGFNEAFGTREDFQALVEAIHQLEMKVMIDIVFNHTSPDSLLSQEHPEWFYRKPDGHFGNHIGEWTDVIDLEYQGNDALWNYQIETLVAYAKIVDGFRCDVASLVPLEFWLKARQVVAEANPDFIWLAESVEPAFILETRRQGITGLSDSEVYQAFDLTYDYDINHYFLAYLRGEIALSRYIESIRQQFWTYPANFTKLRFLENHDQERIAGKIQSHHSLKQLTAFNFFLRGAHLIYNGQEVQADHLPSLFDHDLIDWNWERDFSKEIQRFIQLKKELVPVSGPFEMGADDELEAVWMRYQDINRQVIGVFALNQNKKGEIEVPIEDGNYENQYNHQEVRVKNGKMRLEQDPIYLQTTIPS